MGAHKSYYLDHQHRQLYSLLRKKIACTLQLQSATCIIVGLLRLTLSVICNDMLDQLITAGWLKCIEKICVVAK